jgi:hypothetical protein
MKPQHYLMLLTMAACATTMVKQTKKPVPSSALVTSPVTPSISAPIVSAPATSGTALTVYKTPTLNLPKGSSHAMVEAARYFAQYANSEAFYEYVKETVPEKLEGGNYTDRDTAIKDYRECLNTHGAIDIVWKKYAIIYRKTVIGGWDGKSIKQNSYFNLTPIERAGHWYHEITHACKFTHVSNNITRYPIIRKSWPYQGGYAFEDFLSKTLNPKLAGE